MRNDLTVRLEQFKKLYSVDEAVQGRISKPPVQFIGEEILELAVAALLGIVLNLVLPGRSADAGAEKVPPVPRESYDDLARDFERAENGSNEKGQA